MWSVITLIRCVSWCCPRKRCRADTGAVVRGSSCRAFFHADASRGRGSPFVAKLLLHTSLLVDARQKRAPAPPRRTPQPLLPATHRKCVELQSPLGRASLHESNTTWQLILLLETRASQRHCATKSKPIHQRSTNNSARWGALLDHNARAVLHGISCVTVARPSGTAQ
jgi:hypothetical protein